MRAGDMAITAAAVAALLVGVTLLPEGASPVRIVAAVFNENVLDLKLNGADNIGGFVQASNMLPGDDVAAGYINLSASGTSQNTPSLYDLDFDFRDPLTGTDLITDFLVFRALSYGTDNLLANPGRNLINEIDGNPNLGNGDGLLSLREAHAGANDFPLPGPPSNPTRFSVEFTLMAATPNSIQGKDVTFTVVFQASDTPHEDLN